MSHVRARRLTTRGGVVAVLAALALLGSSVAIAAPTDEVTTPTLRWFDINDARPDIDDAQSGYTDLLGSGVDLPMGWTADAFDGVFSPWRVESPGGLDPITWTPGTQTTTGARSTWTYSGESSATGVEIDVTLEVEGSTARWVVTPTAGPSDATIVIDGNLGSDGNETVVVVDPDTAVVSSDIGARDLVIGAQIAAPDGAVTSEAGDGSLDFTFVSSGPATIVVAVQDFAPCARQVAIDEMIDRVANLTEGFGEVIPGALECATVTAPATLDQGAPVDQELAFAIDPLVDASTSGGVSVNFSLANGPGPYLGDPSAVGSSVVGLPAGVIGTVDLATQTLTLTGTPTESGSFSAALILYRTDVRDYQFRVVGNGIPVVASFDVTVTAPPTVTPPVVTPPGGVTPVPGAAGSGLGSGGARVTDRNLPDTGAGGLPAAVLGLALLALGAGIVASSRPARRS